MADKTKYLLTVFLGVLCLSAEPAVLAASPGDLDPTFSGDGNLIDGIRAHSRDDAYSVAVQADGKIVVAGRGEGVGSPTLARYNADGSLDMSFGRDGLISGCQAGGVAIQADGKIVVGCSLFDGPDSDLVVARYNSDGSLDASFGRGGSILTAITGSGNVNSIALGPDGKIVAVGTIFVGGSDRHIFVARYNTDGSPDTSFDGDGLRMTSIGNYLEGGSVAVQPDGKIVVGGEAYLPPVGFPGVLIRYNLDGSLDTSFDSDGVAVSTVSSGRPVALAIQPDGKIVTAGGTGSSFLLERYNRNGSLDATFDGDGRAITPVNDSNGRLPAGANSVIIQPDGKIVAAGYSFVATGLIDTDIALARYNSNGSLDTTFDIDGKVTTPVDFGWSEINSLAIQPDGKIISVGFTEPNRSDGSSTNDDNFLVARYNANGSLDASFDSDGMVITDFTYPVGSLLDVAVQTDGEIVAVGSQLVRYNDNGTRDTSFGSGGTGIVDIRGSVVELQPDGKILVVSSHSCGDDDSLAATITRLDQNGSIDTSFGDNGTAEFGPCPDGAGYFWFNSITIQPDGKIVAAGGTSTGGGGLLLVRYNINGSLDRTFDADGIVTTPMANASAQFVAVLSDSKIVTAGSSNSGFTLVRYNTDGSVDTTFGIEGKVTTPIGVASVIRAAAIQLDAKIVAAGVSTIGSKENITVARYNPNGSLDATFDSDGIVTTSISPGDDIANAIAIDGNGKLVVAGTSRGDFALLRYLSNGSLDPTFGGGDGISTIDFGVTNDKGNGMVLDGRGRAVIVGSSSAASALARILMNNRAAPVSVSGRVLTPDGQGLRNAIVSLVDGSGAVRTTMTSSFGFYSFSDLQADVTYAITVGSRRYKFTPRTISTAENVSEIDLIGVE